MTKGDSPETGAARRDPRVRAVADCWEEICRLGPSARTTKQPKRLFFEEDGARLPSPHLRMILLVYYLTADVERRFGITDLADQIVEIVAEPGFRRPGDRQPMDREGILRILYATGLNQEEYRSAPFWLRRALVACVTRIPDRTGSYFNTEDFFAAETSGKGAIDALLAILEDGLPAPTPLSMPLAAGAAAAPEREQPLVLPVILMKTAARADLLKKLEDEVLKSERGGPIVIYKGEYAFGLSALGTALAERLARIDGRDQPLVLPLQRHWPKGNHSENFKSYNTIEVLAILRRYVGDGLAAAGTDTNPVSEDDDIGAVIQEMQHLLAAAPRPKTIILDGLHIPKDEAELHENADGRRLRRAIADDIIGPIVEGLMRPPLAGLKSRAESGAGIRAPIDVEHYGRHRFIILASSVPHWQANCAVILRRPEFQVMPPAAVDLEDTERDEGPIKAEMPHWQTPGMSASRLYDTAVDVLKSQRLPAEEKILALWDRFEHMRTAGSDSVLSVLDAIMCAGADGADIAPLWAERPPTLPEIVHFLLEHLIDTGQLAQLQLLLLVSMAPDGIRRDTLRRFVMRAALMPAAERPLPALRALVQEPDGRTAPADQLTAAIAQLGLLLTDARSDSFRAFDSEPHPLELGPDRYDALQVTTARSIDIALPDVKYEIRDQAGELFKRFGGHKMVGGAAPGWHVAQRLLAEDALQQMTTALRHHGAPVKRSIRGWRRMFSVFYHGLLSLPVNIDSITLLDMPISCPDLFAPTRSADYWRWLESFAFNRILEAQPIYRLSRQFGQDRLKEELAALFLRPWQLWPEGVLSTKKHPKGRLRLSDPSGTDPQQAGQQSDNYRRGISEWLSGRVSRADRTFRLADGFLARKHAAKPGEAKDRAAFRGYLRERFPILKRRLDIAHMHCAYVRLIGTDVPSPDAEPLEARLHKAVDTARRAAGKRERSGPLQQTADEIRDLGVAETLEGFLGSDLFRSILSGIERLANGQDPANKTEGASPLREAPLGSPSSVTPANGADITERVVRDGIWAMVDKGYFNVKDDPLFSSMKALVNQVFGCLPTADIRPLIDIFARLGSHEMGFGWLAGASDLLNHPDVKRDLPDFGFDLSAGQLPHFRRAFCWMRFAEELRLELFLRAWDNDGYRASGALLRELVRCALLLEREARRELEERADLGIIERQRPEHARSGYFARKARHHADTMARYHHMLDKERAAMLIVEATMLRRLTEASEDLGHALGYLEHADRILLGMARDSRLRLELSLERSKVNRRLAELRVAEIASARADIAPAKQVLTGQTPEGETVEGQMLEGQPPTEADIGPAELGQAGALLATEKEVKARFRMAVADLDLIRQDHLAKTEPYWRVILRLQEVRLAELGEKLAQGLAKSATEAAPARPLESPGGVP